MYTDNHNHTKHYSSDAKMSAIELIDACKALGMKSSEAHIEIIMTKKGPRIVEIGARSGGYRERMYRLAYGIDITGNTLALALDEALDIKPRKREPVAVLELFPKIAGKFVGIKNEKALKGLASLKYLSIKASPGDYIGKSSEGYKMTAVIVLHNKDLAQFKRDLDYVDNEVRIETIG